jgi:hypothetical protein
MKFLLLTSGIAIICFVVALQTVIGFTPTYITSSMPNTIEHRRQSCHRHFSTTYEFSTQTSSSSSSSTDKRQRVGVVLDKLLDEFWRSEIDDTNLPIIRRSIGRLASGSDIRGKFVPHPSMAPLAQSIGQSTTPSLTPLASHCKL